MRVDARQAAEQAKEAVRSDERVRKLVEWGRKPLPAKALAVAVAFAIAAVLGSFVWFMCYDSDMYFIIASGREILSNGIPYENVWHIDPGYGIVVQQWLYAIVLAVVDEAGPIGFASFVAAEAALFSWCAYRLFRRTGMPRGVAVAFIAVVMMFFREYLLSIRPQLATLLLLILTAECLELWKERESWLWLVPLPLLSLLGVNLHAATWPFHFCILVAYAVPLPFPKGQDMGEAKYILGHLKEFLIAVAAMAGSLFLNPYGLDGILYVFRSYDSGVFNSLYVPEMARTYILSTAGVCLFVCGAFFLGCAKSGALKSGTTNMFLGFGLLSMMAYRNYMLMIVPVVFLLRDAYVGWADRIAKIDFGKAMIRSVIPALVALDLCACWIAYGTYNYSRMCLIRGGSSGTACAYDGIVEYLESEGAQDARIFTQFEIGSLLEYRGFTNVYMDNRSEIYMSDLNGVHSVALDLARYASGVTMSADAVRTPSDYYPVTKAEMDAWLEHCAFDYVCVPAWGDAFLQGYMLKCPDYELAYNSPGAMAVFAKI